jgi:hypothetical protein
MAKPRASQIHLFTPSERTRRRNQEPQEVFRESSKEMRLVPVHHHKAQVPLEVVQHQKRLSRSGENLIGELATWDGQMDDGLLVRFVPARVASLYTATNAMEPKFRSAFLKRYALIIVKSQSSIVALYSKHTRTLTFKEFEGRQEQRKRALRPAFACPVREDEDGSKTTSVNDGSTTTSVNHAASLWLPRDCLQDVHSLPCSAGRGGGGDRKKDRTAQDHEQQEQQQQERKRLQRKLALTPGLTRHKQQVARAKEVGDSVPPEATTALIQDLQDVVLSHLQQLEEEKELSARTQAEIEALFTLKFRHAARPPPPLVRRPQAPSDTDAAIEVHGVGLKVRLARKMLRLEEQQARAQEEEAVEARNGGTPPSLAARKGSFLSIDTSFQHQQPELKAAPTHHQAAPTRHNAASSNQRALLAVESVVTLLEGMNIIAGPERGRKAQEQGVCHTLPEEQEVCHTLPETPPPPSFKVEATGKTSERAEMLVLHTTALDAICSAVSKLETLALELGERRRESESESERDWLPGASQAWSAPWYQLGRWHQLRTGLLEQMRQVEGDIREMRAIALSFRQLPQQMHSMPSQEKRVAAGGFQRISRGRVVAILGEMVLGRERFVVNRLQPHRWMLARLSQTQFVAFLKRLAVETYLHPPDNEAVDDVVRVTQQRAEPNIGSKLKGITLGRGRALTGEQVASAEDVAELRSIFKTADPVTGAVGVKTKAHCALPQLQSALFMHGLAYKAHKFSKVLSVVMLYSKCARTLTFENV